MPSLKFIGKAGPPRVFPIFKHVTTVGRRPENDISLDDPDLSEFHAQVVFDGRDFALQRVTDSPHFIINGKKRKRSKLLHNDRLTVGSSELVFSLFEDVSQEGATDSNADVIAMRRLVEFSARLAALETVTEQLRTLVDAVLELTCGHKAFVLLTQGDKTRITVGRDDQGGDLAADAAQLSDSIIAQVADTQRPLLVNDAVNDTLFRSSHSVMNLQLSSVMCAPLVAQGQMLGILYVGNSRVVSLFTEQTLDLLTVFATQAALILQSALLRDELKQDRDTWAGLLEGQTHSTIVGTSSAIEMVLAQVEKLASSDVSVLIDGETGTGKEMLARALHRRSPRCEGPFVAVNCGAIPEQLMESELFGHVRGAFTGATNTQQGKFELAHGGTLFLDEVAEMPPSLQVKLLRVLQEREVTKVGATTAMPVDIRVISATHQDLATAMGNGTFREDLYYRLRVVGITSPALREREGDITLLAHYFLKRFGHEMSSPARGFSESAVRAMERYRWPGNIRELENRVKKALVLTNRPLLEPEDLDLRAENLEVVPLADAREAFQRQYILDVLEQNDGNRTKTAKELGVDPRTIFRYLEREAGRSGSNG